MEYMQVPYAGRCIVAECPVTDINLRDNPIALRLVPLSPPSSGSDWSKGAVLLLDWAFNIAQGYFACKRAFRVAEQWREAFSRQDAELTISFDVFRKRIPFIALTLEFFVTRLATPYYVTGAARQALGMPLLSLQDTACPVQLCTACAARPQEQHYGPLLEPIINAGINGEDPQSGTVCGF